MAEINFDDIPEQFRELFVEQDGRYTIDTQKIAAYQKNAEDVRRALSARDNERSEAANLRKQMEELQAKFGGLDPERLPDALDALTKVEEMEQQKLIAEKRYEEAAERKYQRQINEMQRQIEALNQTITQEKQQREQLFGDYSKIAINEAHAKELLGAGLHPDILDRDLNMQSRRWEIDPETRKPVPIEMFDGGRQKVTATGSNGQPLTFKEHAQTFLRDRPKWALASSGSNSVHQNGNVSGGQFVMRRDEARQDNRRYEAMVQEAAKVGQQVVFVD